MFEFLQQMSMKAHRDVDFNIWLLELKTPADCRIFISKTTPLYTNLPGKLNSTSLSPSSPFPHNSPTQNH